MDGGQTSATAIVFNFSTADAVYSLGRAQGNSARPYLIEGNGTVSWPGGTTYINSTAICLCLIKSVIQGEILNWVATYGSASQGGIREYNVVNEWAFGGTNRAGTWQTYLGNNWVPYAMLLAYEADPTAMLMLNIEDIETAADTSAQAGFRNTVQACITAGIPPAQIIMGHEFHLTNSPTYSVADASAFLSHIKLCAAMGVWWAATECDITDLADPGTGPSTHLARQILANQVWQNFSLMA